VLPVGEGRGVYALLQWGTEECLERYNGEEEKGKRKKAATERRIL